MIKIVKLVFYEKKLEDLNYLKQLGFCTMNYLFFLKMIVNKTGKPVCNANDGKYCVVDIKNLQKS